MDVLIYNLLIYKIVECTRARANYEK